MSTGTILLAAGIALISVGAIVLIAAAVTYPGSRRRIDEKMKEKY